jgi:hypothetical protein
MIFHYLTNKIAEPTLFADDTSIIISNTNPEEFKSNVSLVLNETINSELWEFTLRTIFNKEP